MKDMQGRGAAEVRRSRDIIPHIAQSLGTTMVPGTTLSWRDYDDDSEDSNGWND